MPHEELLVDPAARARLLRRLAPRRAASASPRARRRGRPPSPPRSRAPSGATWKALTSSGRRVTCSASPPPTGMRQTCEEPERLERNQTERPSADQRGSESPASCEVRRAEPAAVGAHQPQVGAPPVALEVGAAQHEDDQPAVGRDPRVGDAVHREHVVDRERMGRRRRGRDESSQRGRTPARGTGTREAWRPPDQEPCRERTPHLSAGRTAGLPGRGQRLSTTKVVPEDCVCRTASRWALETYLAPCRSAAHLVAARALARGQTQSSEHNGRSEPGPGRRRLAQGRLRAHAEPMNGKLVQPRRGGHLHRR